MHSWLLVCRRLISSSGMLAWVCSSVLRAWATSSSVIVPAFKLTFTIFNVFRWRSTFCWAYLIRCSVVRYCA